MRYAPLPWLLPHTAVHDVHYKGIGFAEGDTVLVLLPATNRDPTVMAEPHRFDISRPRVRNFSFGQGARACPAAQPALIEMAIALERLVTQTTMRLVEAPTLTASGKAASRPHSSSRSRNIKPPRFARAVHQGPCIKGRTSTVCIEVQTLDAL